MAKSTKKGVYNHDSPNIHVSLGLTDQEISDGLDSVQAIYKLPNIKISEIIEKAAENVDKRILAYALFSLLQTQKELFSHPFLGELNRKAVEAFKNK